jgi:hypothetical protein
LFLVSFVLLNPLAVWKSKEIAVFSGLKTFYKKYKTEQLK